MNYFILDKHLKTVAIAQTDSSSRNAFHVLEDSFVEYSNAPSTLELTLDFYHESALEVKEGAHVVFKYEDVHRLFQIKQVEEQHASDSYVKIYAEESSYELLDAVVFANDYVSVSAEYLLGICLADTDWQVGDISPVTVEAHSFGAYDTALKAVQDIATETECKLQFRINFSPQKGVTGKYVDLLEKIEVDEGKRLEFGRNVDTVKRTVDRTTVCTAVIPVGANDTVVSGFDWVNVYEDKTISKVKDLYYLEVDEATRSEINPNSGHHLFYVLQDESSDKATLCQRAYKYLTDHKEPKYTYEVDAIHLQNENYRIGEQVRIIDDELGVSMVAEVEEKEISFCDPSKDSITLTNYIEQESSISQVLYNIQNQLQSSVIDNPLIVVSPDQPLITDVKGNGTIWIDISKTEEGITILNKYDTVAGEWTQIQQTPSTEKVTEEIEEKNELTMQYIDEGLLTKEQAVFKQATEPENPRVNQLWIDTSTDPYQYKVWTGTEWKNIGATKASDIGAPTVEDMQQVQEELEAKAEKIQSDLESKVEQVETDAQNKITETQQQLTQTQTNLQNKITETQTNIANTKAELEATIADNKAEADATAQELAQTKADLQGKIDTNVENINQTISDLEETRTNLQNQINQAATNLTNTKTELQTQIDANETAIANAKAELQEQINNANSDMEQANQDLADARAKLQEQINANKATAEQLQTDLTNAKNDLQEQADELKQETAGLQGSVNTINAEIDEINGQLDLTATQSEVDNLTGRVSQNEANISANAQQISLKVEQTDIDDAVNNIQIGGVNLVTGTTDEWKDITVSQYSGKPYYGLNGVSDHVIHYSELGLVVGDYLTYTVDVKAINKPLNLRLDTHEGESTSTPYSMHVGNRLAIGETGTSTVTIQITEEQPYLAFYIGNGDYINYTTATTEQYKCLKIEKGNKATTWSPSPYDVSSKITANATAITQNANEISLRATKSEVETMESTLTEKIDENEASINVLNNQITLKVDNTTYTTDKATMTQLIEDNKTAIEQNAEAITLKADQTTVDTLTGEVEANAAQLEVQAGQIATKVTQTEIDTAIDNLEIGTRNLYILKNSESGYLVDGSEDLFTPHSFRKERTSEYIPVKAGETYILQVWYTYLSIDTNPFYDMWLCYKLYDANKTVINYRVAKTTYDELLANGQRYAYMTINPTVDGFIRVSARQYDDGKIMLTKGTKVVDWQPAPEDMATGEELNNLVTRVTTAESNITQNANEIALKVSQTTYETDRAGLQESIESNTSLIQQNADNIALKVSQSTYDTGMAGVNTRLDSAEATLEVQADKIALKVEQTDIDTAIDSLEIGGRNLLLDSKKEINNSRYDISKWNISVPEEMIVGETYTLTYKATLGEGRTGIGFYNSGGMCAVLNTTVNDLAENGICTKTFEWKDTYTWEGIDYTVSNTFLAAYQFPSTGTSTTEIEWIKLEKGNMATDYSPAPEDTENDIASLDTRITTNESSITLLNNEIALKVSQTEFNNLQIGGKNLYLESDNIRVSSNDTNITREKISDDVYGENVWHFVQGETFGNFIKIYDTYLKYNELTPNEDFTVSLLVKAVEREGYAPEVSFYYNASTGYKQMSPNVGTDWTWVSYTFNTSDIVPLIHIGMSRLSELYIARIQVEKGNKATQWQPAPEDTQSSINDLGTRLTTAESSITQNADQIALKVNQSTYETDKAGLQESIESNTSLIQQNADNIALKVSQTDYDSDIAGINQNISNNTAQLEIQAGQIASKVDATTYNNDKTNLQGQITSNKSAIEQNAEEITLKVEQSDINNAIGNLAIGGRNLILKSDFKDKPASYGITAFNGDVVTFTSDTVGKTSSSDGISFSVQVSPYAKEVLRNKEFTISMEYWVEEELTYGTTSPWVGAQLTLTRADSSKTQWFSWFGEKNLPRAVTNGWVKNHVVVKSSDIAIDMISFNIYFRDVKGKIKYRHPKVEIGNKATDWTLAPEDLETEVDNLTTRVSSAETNITQNATEIALRATKSELLTSLTNKGTNLIVNGDGSFNDVTNIAGVRFDATTIYDNKPSFTCDFLSSVYSKEYIPVDPTRTYELSMNIKVAEPVQVNQYFGFICYDIDKKNILPDDCMYIEGSTTTLAQDLKAGDTVVYLTDVSGFNTSLSQTYQRSFIFWNYTNSYGYTYPIETYSKNHYWDLWEDASSFDATNNTITLKNAWTGSTYEAGTPVSQNSSGSTFHYALLGGYINTTEWQHKSGRISGYHSNNAYKFRPGTVYIRFNGSTRSTIQHWFNNIQLLDITEEVNANAYTTTQVNNAKAEIKVTTDAIQSSVSQTQSTVDDLGTRMTSAESTLEQHADSIASKVDVTTYEAGVDGLDARISSNTSLIQQNADEIALKVSQTEFDSLQIGATNLLLDTSNEKTVTANDYNYSYATYTIDPAPLKNGVVYTVSANIEVLAGDVTTVTIATYDSAISSGTWFNGATITDGRIVKTITVDRENMAKLLIYAGQGGHTAGNSIKLTNVKLEEGTKATTWSPNPSDIEADITSLESSITLLNNEIALKVTQTDVDTSISELTIGARNYFVRKDINNLAWASTNSLLENTIYRGYSFPVTEGEKWTLYRTGTTNNRWGVYWFTEEPKADLTAMTGNNFREDGQAANVVNYLTVPAGATWGFIYLSNQADEIPNIMLEKGNKATDWKPAPEDTEEDINNLTTRVETNESSITLMKDQINLKVDSTTYTSDKANLQSQITTNSSAIQQNKNAIALKVEQTDINNAIADLEIGGKNLLLDSNAEVTNNSYAVRTYTPSEYLVEGETYTVQLCVTPAPNVSNYQVYVSSGYDSLIMLKPDGTTNKQILTGTFTARYYEGRTPDIHANYGQVQIYRFPNDGTVTEPSTIHWIKVEKGDKATDYTPAPEDLETRVESNEASLVILNNQIATKVTQTEIDNAINDLTIGSTNLLKDSNGYIIHSNNNVNYPILNTDMEENGRYFRRITRTSQEVNPTTLSTYNVIPVGNVTKDLSGRTVTFSYWVRCSHTRTLRSWIALYDTATKSYAYNNSSVSTVITANEWTRVVFTVTLPTYDYSTTQFRLSPYSVTIPEGEIANFWLDSCELQIEEGNKVTAWKPAPEDLETRVATAESSITQHADQIALKVDTATYTTDKANLQQQITSNSSLIQQNADKIELKVEQSDIDDAISDIEVGGRNLVLKSNQLRVGSAESGLTATESGGIMTVVSPQSSGNYVSFNTANWDLTNVENNLTEGDAFTFSCMIKSDDCADTTSPTIYIKSGMGYYSMQGEVSSTWSQVWYTGTWKDANTIALHFGFINRIGTYQIKNIQIEKGNIPTAWTLAPEDIETKVETNTSNITLLNNQIALKVDNTTYTTDKANLQSQITNNSSLIQQNADNITTKVSQTEFNNLQIGGRNLLKNTTDEVQSCVVSGWQYYYRTAHGVYSNLLSSMVGQKLTLSGYIKNVSGTEDVGLMLHIVTPDRETGYWQAISTQRISAGQEGWVTHTFTVPSQIATITEAYPGIRHYSGSATDSTVEHHSLQLEIGNRRTAWTPALEDMETTVNNLTNRVSTAESSITQNANEIATKVTQTQVDATVNNAVNNIEIGGRNYILNAGFTNNTEKWSYASTNTYSIVDAGYTGKGMQIVIDNNATVHPRQGIQSEFKTGEILSGSVKVKVVSGNFDNFVMRFANTHSLLMVGKEKLDNDWYLYKYQGTLTKDIPKNTIIGFSGGELGTYIIDEVKLEKGNKWTDFTLAPEDTDEKITSLGTRVSSAESTIEQHADQIALKVNQTTYDTGMAGVTNRLSNAESTLAVHTNQIATKVTQTEINNAISGIEVSGRNLVIFNPSNFNNYLAETYTKDLNNYTVNIAHTTSGNFGIRIPYTVLEADKWYVLSFKVRKLATTGTETFIGGHCSHGNHKFYVDGVATGVGFTSSSSIGDNTDTHEVVLHFYTNQMGSSDPNVYIQINRGKNNLPEYACQAELSEIMLEQGTVASDWSPSPEDTKTRISNAESSITQNANEIALKVNQTTYDSGMADVDSRLDTAEATLEVQADQIATKVTQTEIDNAIADIEIGGRNLLKDTGKELAYVLWSSDKSNNVTKYQDAQKVLINVAGTSGNIYQWFNDDVTIPFNEFLVIGESYTYSIDIKVTGSATGVWSGFDIRGANHARGIDIRTYANGSGKQTLTNSDWVRIYGTAQVTANGEDYTSVLIRVDWDDATEGTIVEWRNLKLEKGTKATAWSPAPEDVQADINSLDTRVTTAESSITQNANEIALKVNQSTYNSGMATVNSRLSSAESSLTVQAGQIASKVSQTDFNSLKSDFNNLEIGTRNYIAMSNTFNGYSPYNTVTKDLTNNTLTLVTLPNHNYITLEQRLPNGTAWKPDDDVYTVSGYITVDGEIATENPFNVNRVSTYGTFIKDIEYDSETGYFSSTLNFVSTSTWILHCQMDVITADNTVSHTFVFKNLQMEKGNKATDWKPAPEDIERRMTSAETSITQNTNQIALRATKTEVTEAISNIEIGSTNLFSGYGNEEIRLNDYQGVGGFTQFFNKLTFDPATTVGQTYTVSFWAKSPNGTTRIVSYNNNGNPRYFYYFGGYMTIDNTWKKYTYTFTNTDMGTTTNSGNPTNTTASIVNRIEIYAPDQLGVLVKEIQVEKGNKATDWKPCLNDFDTRIEEAEAELVVQAGQIASKVSQSTYDIDKTNLESKVNSNTTLIQQNAGEIALKAYTSDMESAIVQAVDDVKVGGTNLFKQSGRWTSLPTWWESNGGGMTLDASTQYLGYNTLKTTVGYGIVGNNFRYFEVDPNKVYTFSAMMKCNEAYAGTSATPLHYHCSNDGTTNSAGVTIIKYDQSCVANEWKLHYLTFKPNGKYFRPFIYIGASGTRYYNIAYMKLEEGNKPTDWTPSPDETNETITALANRVSTAETNITTNANNISLAATKTEVTNQITQAVENIEIGGANLLENSKFDTDFTGWSYTDDTVTETVTETTDPDTGEVTTTVTSTVTDTGFKIVEHEGENVGHVAGTLTKTKTCAQSILNVLEPNQTYTLSGWVKVTDYVAGTTNPYVAIYLDGSYTDSEGTVTWLSYGGSTGIQSYSDWTYLTATFTTDEAKFATLTRYQFIVYARDFTGNVYFKELKLEKGNKATDWTPSPAQLVTQISDLQSRMQNAEISIESDAIIHTVLDSEAYLTATQNYVVSDDITNMATKEDVETAVDGIDFTGKIDERINEQLSDDASALVSTFTTKSELTQTKDEINMNFSMAGGINLIKNSLGFSGVNDGNWFFGYSGTETTEDDSPYILCGYDPDAELLGFDSSIKLSGKTSDYIRLNQRISTVVGQAYVLSLYAKVVSGTLDVRAADSDWGQIANLDGATTTEGYQFLSLPFTATSSTTIVRFLVHASGDVSLTGIMVNRGTVPFGHTFAKGENYNTNINFDASGIKVMQLDNNGNPIGYTIMSPNEFAGYYDTNADGNYEKIFYLNQDAVVSKRSVATTEIIMGKLKYINLDDDVYKGWAMVPSTVNDWNIVEGEEEAPSEETT